MWKTTKSKRITNYNSTYRQINIYSYSILLFSVILPNLIALTTLSSKIKLLKMSTVNTHYYFYKNKSFEKRKATITNIVHYNIKYKKYLFIYTR